ncbi:MAG TPA: exonuclease SbcCD subunit D [Acidimicrobiia bacterium]
MKLLHTSDWHVGKLLKGASRLDEHRRVLSEIAGVARSEAVDVIVVAGDVYESAAPTPEAQGVALQAILELRDTGAKVVVIAGNHDNPHQFEALRPVMAELDITMLGHPARADAGGVVEVTTSGGERVCLALLPFCSQRYIVRAAELMAGDAAQHAGDYAQRMRALLGALSGGFSDDSVNVVVAHCMARGGRLGGGERDAQTVEPYWVSGTAFPSAHYVALGHLHLTQEIPGAAPIWYSGSPIQVDFGEQGDAKHVLVVEATPTTPAKVREVSLASGVRLATAEGTFAELSARAGEFGDAYLRVIAHEPARAGLADELRALLGERVVEVRLDTSAVSPEARPQRRGRSAHDLFAGYLHEQNYDDDRLVALFDRLLDSETTV